MGKCRYPQSHSGSVTPVFLESTGTTVMLIMLTMSKRHSAKYMLLLAHCILQYYVIQYYGIQFSPVSRDMNGGRERTSSTGWRSRDLSPGPPPCVVLLPGKGISCQ